MVTAAPPDWRAVLERTLVPPPDAPPHVHWLHELLPAIPERTKGAEVIRFVERFCVHGEGDWYGKPFRLRWWQKRLILKLYELRADGSRRFQRALIGFPKGQGKTELAAALGLYETLASGTVSPLVPVAAASKDQANLVFGAAKIMCEESDALRSMTTCGVDVIQLRGAPGRLYRVAASDGTNDGQRPSAAIFDELHEWSETKNVFVVLSNGTAKRANSFQLYITTAGYDLDSICGRLYQYGRKANAGEIVDERFFMFWLEPDPEDDPADVETWRKVNPAGDDFWPLENLREKFETLPLAQFERYFLNRWTAGESHWLPPGLWASCKAETGYELEEGQPTWLACHSATEQDTTGVVGIQWRSGALYDDGEPRLRVKAWWWERPLDDYLRPVEEWRLPTAKILETVEGLYERYEVKGIAYSPRFVTWLARSLEESGLPMIKWPTTSVARMAPATQAAYALIVEGRLEHDGNPALARHVEVVDVVSLREGGQRIVAGRWPSELAFALVMAVGMAILEPPEEEQSFPGVIALY